MELADRDNRICVDLRCIRCGYNLRSLAADQACTECGHPIPQSFPLWTRAPGTLRRLALLSILLAGSLLASRFAPPLYWKMVEPDLVNLYALNVGDRVRAAVADDAKRMHAFIRSALEAMTVAVFMLWLAGTRSLGLSRTRGMGWVNYLMIAFVVLIALSVVCEVSGLPSRKWTYRVKTASEAALTLMLALMGVAALLPLVAFRRAAGSRSLAIVARAAFWLSVLLVSWRVFWEVTTLVWVLQAPAPPSRFVIDFQHQNAHARYAVYDRDGFLTVATTAPADWLAETKAYTSTLTSTFQPWMSHRDSMDPWIGYAQSALELLIFGLLLAFAVLIWRASRASDVRQR